VKNTCNKLLTTGGRTIDRAACIVKENVLLVPNLVIEARDVTNGHVRTERVRNLVVNNGLALLRDLA